MSSNEEFARRYRDTIGRFATGVTVVVAGSGDDVHGMTVNAITSVSLAPVMLLFCPAKDSRMAKYCEEDNPFTVSILAAEQENTANHFAGADMAPEHDFVDWPEAGGPPRIDGCLAALACTMRDIYDGGDHWIVLGEVTDLYLDDDEDQEPLLFYAGRYRELASEDN